MAFELIYPVDNCFRAMRDGKADFVAGSAHSVLAAFPEWKGAKLLCSLAQGMYWFLVLRADLKAKRGDVTAVKGLRIGAAPWVDIGLKRLLVEAGIDLAKDNVTIAPVPGAAQAGVSFGVTAAKALEDGKIDGFWANGMGAEVAVRRGVGTVVLDVRRGDGPKAAFSYTMPALSTTDALIMRNPDAAAAAVRAIIKTQRALKADVAIATKVGEKHFPPMEASLIAEVVARDLPFYDPRIGEDFVRDMNRFAQDVGVLKAPAPYDSVVATRFSHLWNA
jgi:ABC-type nitrate/sulfonate/bicarbonate transport system substrate-binding protein